MFLQLAFWGWPSPGSFISLVYLSPGSQVRAELTLPPAHPAAPWANLFEIFSYSMALASNCISCFPPSIGTPSSLPGTESNLSKPARTKAGGGRLIASPFCAQAETKAAVVADSSRARIPKKPRGPVAPSGSPSTES